MQSSGSVVYICVRHNVYVYTYNALVFCYPNVCFANVHVLCMLSLQPFPPLYNTCIDVFSVRMNVVFQ